MKIKKVALIVTIGVALFGAATPFILRYMDKKDPIPEPIPAPKPVPIHLNRITIDDGDRPPLTIEQRAYGGGSGDIIRKDIRIIRSTNRRTNR